MRHNPDPPPRHSEALRKQAQERREAREEARRLADEQARDNDSITTEDDHES